MNRAWICRLLMVLSCCLPIVSVGCGGPAEQTEEEFEDFQQSDTYQQYNQGGPSSAHGGGGGGGHGGGATTGGGGGGHSGN